MVDDGLSPEDSAIDGVLRAELGRSFPSDGPTEEVLLALAPAAKRARRNRVAGHVLVGATASLLLVGGIGLAIQALSPPGRNVTVAGEPDQASVTVGVSTTEGDLTSRSIPEVGELPPPVPTPSDPPGPTTESTTAAEPPSVTVPTSVTTYEGTATSTTPQSTTPTGSENRLGTRCGTVVVSVIGDRITLVDVEPDPGYSVDRKSDGPEKVEVAFENGSDECELKVRVKDGELEIDDE